MKKVGKLMIIEKIRHFLKKLFNKDSIKYIETKKIEKNADNKQYTKEKDTRLFKEEIKLQNKENSETINLQKEFEEGKIKAEDISEENRDILIDEYIKQIMQKLKRINEYEVKSGIQ